MMNWSTISCTHDKSCISFCAAIKAVSLTHQRASLALVKKYSGMQLKVKGVMSSGLLPQEAPVFSPFLKGVMHQFQAHLWYRVIELELGQWHGAATSCPLAAETVTFCIPACFPSIAEGVWYHAAEIFKP